VCWLIGQMSTVCGVCQQIGQYVCCALVIGQGSNMCISCWVRGAMWFRDRFLADTCAVSWWNDRYGPAHADIHICTYVYISIYVCICIERERDRESSLGG